VIRAFKLSLFTAKLELTHLHKMFKLAERAGKVICPPFPQIGVQNVRTGFFERTGFEAVRSHLPEAFQGAIMFAYLTGWRTPSEVLTLRWKQVDFEAGIVRLEPGTTKNDEGGVSLWRFTRTHQALAPAMGVHEQS
jgi:integrase